MLESCAYPSHPPPVDGVPLTVLPDRACPYLPGRTETIRGFLCDEMHPAVYHAFMDRAFRRSGRFFYQPVCRGCRQCRPIRVPVERFVASKSQRRAWRRNEDLTVTVTPRPRPSREKYDLYLRYQRERHNPERVDDASGFVDFLYQSAVESLEFAYRDGGGKLIGVGIGDVCRESLSSVYFYFDPAESRRSLGIFSAMWEMQFAAREQIPHYYLGYWVRDCAAMTYKAHFRPFEVLGPDGVWRRGDVAGDAAWEAKDDAAAATSAAGDSHVAAGGADRPRDENCPAPAVEMP